MTVLKKSPLMAFKLNLKKTAKEDYEVSGEYFQMGNI